MAIEECSKCGFEYGDRLYDDDDPHVRYRKILEEYKSRHRNSDSDGESDEYMEPSRPSSDSNRIFKIWTREIDHGFNIITYTCPNCGYGNKVPFDED